MSFARVGMPTRVGLRDISTDLLVESNRPSAAHFGRVERATPSVTIEAMPRQTPTVAQLAA